MTVGQKLVKFFSEYKQIKLKRGDIIIRAQDPIFGINYLKKGLVKQYIETEDGEEVIIHIFRPGSLFPIMVPIAETENNYYFEALEPVEILRAPTEKVMEFIKGDPEVLFDLTKRFAQGLNGLAKRIEELTGGGGLEKITSLLTYLSSRYGEKTSGGTKITILITHRDIASWTGLTRETVSRHIEKLIKQNTLSYQNHQITIR